MPRDYISTYISRTFCDRVQWAKTRITIENKSTVEFSWFETMLKVAGVGLKLTALEALGKKKALDVKVNRQSIVSSKLPSPFDGFKILQISDPHFDMIRGLDASIIRAVKNSGPVDICVLTGDYRMADEGPHDHIMPALKEIVETVETKYGVWAIFGNHDDHQMIESFETIGINCLINEHLFISKDDATLQFTGLDDINKFWTPQAEKVLKVEDDAYAIALIHSPEYVEEAANAGYQLYLSGHTHGGQICLPNGRPLVTHLKKGHAFAKGFWSYEGMLGITSNGAGVSGLPVRFFSHSEVNVICLCKTDEFSPMTITDTQFYRDGASPGLLGELDC